MNSIARIANTVVNSIVSRIANNTDINRANIVTEDTTMNTNKIARIVHATRRAAASLFALGGLLALSHTAKADVEIYRFVQPSQAQFVPQGSTFVQIKAGNTDTFNVSNLQFSIRYYVQSPNSQVWEGVSATSDVFNLNPVGHTGESLWLNIPVPARSEQGTSLYGKYIIAVVKLNGKLMTQVNNILDVAPAPNVRATGKMTGQTYQPDGTTLNNYQLTFTNSGYAASPAQTVTVQMQRYADGPDGAPYTLTLQIPALRAGQSYTTGQTYTVNVTSQPTQGKDIRGTILSSNNTVMGTF